MKTLLIPVVKQGFGGSPPPPPHNESVGWGGGGAIYHSLCISLLIYVLIHSKIFIYVWEWITQVKYLSNIRRLPSFVFMSLVIYLFVSFRENIARSDWFIALTFIFWSKFTFCFVKLLINAWISTCVFFDRYLDDSLRVIIYSIKCQL